MEIIEVLEITNLNCGTGKYRLTVRTDDPVTEPFGLCKHEHATKEEAKLCPDARAKAWPEEKKTDTDEVAALKAKIVKLESVVKAARKLRRLTQFSNEMADKADLDEALSNLAGEG